MKQLAASNCAVWSSHDEGRKTLATLSSSDVQRLKRAIRDTDIIPANLIDVWLDSPDSTVQYGLILALLLSHLPDLDVFSIAVYDMPIVNLVNLTQRIKERPVGTFLPHLKELWVKIDPAWDMNDVLDFVDLFATLPSLANLIVHNLAISNDDYDLERILRPHESNISQLAFLDCRFTTESLLLFITYPMRLRSFTYEDAPFLHAPRPKDWWDKLYLGLSASSASSLENLVIRTEDAIYSENWNLRDFKVLRKVEAELDMFFNINNSGVQTLSEMLPPSIQILRLKSTATQRESVVSTCAWFYRIRESILDVVDHKYELVPHLTEIQLRLYYGAPTSILQGISEVCNARQVSFILQGLD